MAYKQKGFPTHATRSALKQSSTYTYATPSVTPEITKMINKPISTTSSSGHSLKNLDKLSKVNKIVKPLMKGKVLGALSKGLGTYGAVLSPTSTGTSDVKSKQMLFDEFKQDFPDLTWEEFIKNNPHQA